METLWRSPSHSSNLVYLTFSLQLLLAQQWLVGAWFEHCASNSIMTVSANDCPFGVLYKQPREVGNCFYPTTGDQISNVCTDERDPDASRKIQFIDPGQDDEEGPSSSAYSYETCKDPGDGEPMEEKCRGDYIKITKDNAGGDESSADYGEVNDTMTESDDGNVDRANVNVRGQTLRLFLYLSGLLVDESENMPVLRLVRLLKKSFDVLRKYCSAKYVPHEFSKEVLRAFLFLLRESDLAHVQDISVQEFSKINDVLDRCLRGNPPNPFYLSGTVCKASSKISSIVKTWGESYRQYNKTHPLMKSTDFSFKWGKYDVPVDATWSVMDFTHGMCYGTFKDDMNSHHLYEQALERLFTPELVYRWSRPVKLVQESFWDHMLRGYAEVAMKNMDACIQAAYIGSPYLHRLSRPMVKQQSQSQPSTRKKRQASMLPGTWCFTSQEERDEAMKLVKGSC